METSYRNNRQDLQDELQNNIEALIDKNTLAEVIEALETICYLKSQHLIENWQDAQTSKVWARAGKKLGKLLSYPTCNSI